LYQIRRLGNSEDFPEVAAAMREFAGFSTRFGDEQVVAVAERIQAEKVS
jgi:hypothetical protein